VKVVLDTNIVLSALVFRRGKLAWLRPAWEKELFVPLVKCRAMPWWFQMLFQHYGRLLYPLHN